MSQMIDGPRFCGARLVDTPPRLCNRLKGHDGPCSRSGTEGLCSLIAGEPQCAHRPCGCFPASTPGPQTGTPAQSPDSEGGA